MQYYPKSREMEHHASLRMRAGVLSVRDALVSDVAAYVQYWHNSSSRHLQFLGVDKVKLGSIEETQARFLNSIRRPQQHQPSVVFSLCLNERVIGYTNINCYGPADNYPHLHTYRTALRDALETYDGAHPGTASAGAGVAAVLVGMVMQVMFDLLPIQRMVLQTRTRNVGINRALDLYMPVAETRHFDNPDGVAGPGEFHIRYVQATDASWMFDRARRLAQGEKA